MKGGIATDPGTRRAFAFSLVFIPRIRAQRGREARRAARPGDLPPARWLGTSFPGKTAAAQPARLPHPQPCSHCLVPAPQHLSPPAPNSQLSVGDVRLARAPGRPHCGTFREKQLRMVPHVPLSWRTASPSISQLKNSDSEHQGEGRGPTPACPPADPSYHLTVCFIIAPSTHLPGRGQL